MSSLFDKTTDALATSMKMRQVRHSITASNIANAETPHYHAKKVEFENALASALDMDGNNAMSTTSGQHFSVGGKPALNPEIYDNPDIAVNNDGNTVDLEKEMSALAENSILYKSALQLINKKMASLKYAISESR
ncbi:MAG: flagellar basal body rod protein FlgB [Pseudobdellovibrio sp.]